MTRGGQADDGLFKDYGSSCPVCGAPLGEPPAPDRRSGRFFVPPCFELELGPPNGDGDFPWRVTPLGGNTPKLKPRSSKLPFAASEVEYAYLLCSDGHIFPKAAPEGNPDGRAADAGQRVHRWNMVGAIGVPASGKTYLLIRMMSQQLAAVGSAGPGRLVRHHLNPLEQVPLEARFAEYARTVADHRAINPTQDEDTWPALILEQVVPDAVDAIREIIRSTVHDGDHRAERWGKGVRQPLVTRTGRDAAFTWTGIADLPGELFGPDNRNRSQRLRLRSYDALIWVIDPVVAAAALDPLTRECLSASADYDSVLDGSLRPGTTVVEGPASVRESRARTQLDIGRNLSLVGNDFVAEQGRALEMLVAVTKCDLLHAALRTGKRLAHLGRREQVRQGTASFLAAVVSRWGAGRLTTDIQSEKLLQYLYSAPTAQSDVRQERIYQVADALIEHYSDAEAFWGLVHEGTPDLVDVAPAAPSIAVPSIDEHLDQSMATGAGEVLLVRDLVMSAVGCGVGYGLGQEEALSVLQRTDWQRLRVFLCSSLGTVPVTRTAVAGLAQVHRLEPLESTSRFAAMSDRSAALTQLLVAALRKARA